MTSISKGRDDRPWVFQTLDAWRGVAAIGVLFTHIVGFLWLQDSRVFENLALRVLGYGDYGVELFFVISGYCIAAACASTLTKQRTVGSFVTARVRRIFPAYWGALVLLLGGVLLWRWAHDGHPVSGPLAAAATLWPAPVYFSNAALLHLSASQPSLLAVSWTLCYELAFYLICAAVLALLGRRGKTDTVLWGLHGVTVVSLLLLVLAPRWSRYPLDLWPEFGVGVLVFDLLYRSWSARLKAVALGILGLLAAFAMLYPHHLLGVAKHESSKAIPITVLFAALLLLLRRYDATLARSPLGILLGKVGYFSYSLYLTHYILIAFWSAQMLTLPPQSRPQIGLQFALLTALCLGAGYLFHLLFERPLLQTRSRAREVVPGAETAAAAAPAP